MEAVGWFPCHELAMNVSWVLNAILVQLPIASVIVNHYVFPPRCLPALLKRG